MKMAEATTKTPDTSDVLDLGLEMQEREQGGSGGAERQQPQKPYIKIIEEPAQKTRFRYKADGHTGTVPGEKTTFGKKSHVKVQIVGYQGDQGPAKLIVSLVEANRPYRQHPHKLVDCNCKNGECKCKGRCCKNGVFVMDVSASSDMICAIKNLGIRRVLKKEVDVKVSLEERKAVRVDPFQQVNNSSKYYSLKFCLLKWHAII